MEPPSHSAGRTASAGRGAPVSAPAASAPSSIVTIAEECRRLSEAQTLSRVGSWEFTLATERFSGSDSMLELFGLEAEDADAWDKALERIHDDDRDHVRAEMRLLVRYGQDLSIRYRVVVAGETEVRWIDARGRAFRDGSGAIIRVMGTVADISEHVRAENGLRAAHAELVEAHSHQQTVITASPDAIHVYDVETATLSRANRLAPPLIGYTDETVAVISGFDLDRWLPPEDKRRLEEAFAAAASAPDGEVVQFRHRIRSVDGVIHWLSRRMTPFKRVDGRVSQVLVVSRDVTDVVAVEERLAYAALHDELTGLPNRRLVQDRLEHALLRAERDGQVAVLFCDLDGFKRINDAHGHQAGDEVLVVTAQRLSTATRGGDTVARMGGDEFVIVLEVPEDADPHHLVHVVAERIEKAVAEPVLLAHEELSVSASIGICLADRGATAEAVLINADTAMYHAKTNGRNRHAFFSAELRRDSRERDGIERQIRRALAEHCVEVYYQPILNRRTNELHGVEALLRLSDNQGTLLDAGSVIAVAEQTGLIVELDDRVLHLACGQVAGWRRSLEYSDLTLSLNRSARDISQPGFYDRVAAALSSSGLDPAALTLELTETVLFDASADALADLHRLRNRGVGISIDDFGTGYASLRYLATLPVTGLKIDRSFTTGLPHDQICMTLVRATIGLADDLGLHCVVEGVETLEQLLALPEYDWLYIQGYLYGRPQAASSYAMGPPISRVA